MAIKNMSSQVGGELQMSDITWEQQRAYPNYTKEELRHVKYALSTTKSFKHKIESLLEEVKLCRDFQTSVPRDKHYADDDIDQEFDQAIDGLECVIQAIQNFEDNRIIGERMSGVLDGRFYARR